MNVLTEVEKRVNQHGTLENSNPNLKSFFKGKTTVVERGIEGLLALIMHDKFDCICEKENVV